MPPALPATADTLSSSECSAFTVTYDKLFTFIFVPSSMPATTSTPVTATAIPAPTPMPALSLLPASATVSTRSFENAFRLMAALSLKVTSAFFNTTAVVFADATCTVTAPPTPIAPCE